MRIGPSHGERSEGSTDLSFILISVHLRFQKRLHLKPIKKEIGFSPLQFLNPVWFLSMSSSTIEDLYATGELVDKICVYVEDAMLP